MAMRDNLADKVSAISPETLLHLGAGLLILVGCGLVLRPFLPAVLYSSAIVMATWPLHRRLLQRLHGRRNVASLVSCLVVALLVIAPTVALAMSLRDALVWLFDLIDAWRRSALHDAADWSGRVPLVGESLQRWLAGVAAGDSHVDSPTLASLAEPARRVALAGARALGSGLLQTLLAGLLLFLFYRDGERIALRLRQFMAALGGAHATDLLEATHRTIVGVMISVIGTALAQAAVAVLGFAVAGVPQPLFLGSLTFVLSVAPVGPPLIWGGAAIWLVRHGEPGWALFMAVYGVLVISLVDNVVKPLLISRSSRLPFVLTFMGVIGGVLAFGVEGVFIGPVLLALAIRLASRFPAAPRSGQTPGQDADQESSAADIF